MSFTLDGDPSSSAADPFQYDLSLPDGTSFQYSNFGDTLGTDTLGETIRNGLGSSPAPSFAQAPELANAFQGQSWMSAALTDVWDGLSDSGGIGDDLGEGGSWQ